MTSEAARISSLRMRMLEHHPFWGYLLLQVRIVPDPNLPAIAATDCVRHIWYNPKRTRKLDNDQLGFVLAHEIGHRVYASFERTRGRNPRLWNRATDYAINRIVAAIPHPSGKGALYRPVPGILLDRRYDGLIAEAIYERLLEEGAAEPAFRVTLNSQPVDDHGGGLDVHLPGELSSEDRERLTSQVSAALAYADAQLDRGDVPGEVARLFGNARSRVPWQRVFRHVVTSALAKEEYDARRPHLRWASQGFVMPSLADERVGSVVVALDTSGSMGPTELDAACGELRALAFEVRDLTLLVADAAVQEVVSLDGLEAWLTRGRARGGGGTDHRPVFDWVRNTGRPPDLFIGLTDLHTRLPEKAPPYPVVWVVPPRHGPARFGRVIEVGGL